MELRPPPPWHDPWQHRHKAMDLDAGGKENRDAFSREEEELGKQLRDGNKRWIVINNKRIVKEGAGSKTRALEGKTNAKREGTQLSSSSIKLVFAMSELVKRP
ncbi:hypothetical protein E2562_032745 [Oryza meyeriana var. granulata]|uniref:Uncharacterized protein n=1 Tax=Oryza meyeriana var. granulata TaxID=110450 RepID=A0A6G1E7X6_9ORYZ|nr:hypothetical protein E2562_032745 [Oryza meyeriana var. granulata]